MPAVTKPEGHVHFKSKLLWTLVALIAYFFMANVFIYGLSSSNTDVFAQFRAILAGQNGSLVHLGIGPIVTGSIIMQLFTGAKIIKLDLTKPEDKSIYQGTQKILVVVMIFVEAIPQVFGFLTPSTQLPPRLGLDLQLGMGLAFGVFGLAAFGYLIGSFSGESTRPAAVAAIGALLGVFAGYFFVNGTAVPLAAVAHVTPMVGAGIALGVAVVVALASWVLSSQERSALALAPAFGGLVAGFALWAVLNPNATLGTDGQGWARFLIILQLAIGSYLVFLLDEVVSKWGIGSGISLFIAAGVSQTLFIGTFNWVPPCPDKAYGIAADCVTANGTVQNIPPGTIPRTLYLLSAFDTNSLVHGGGFETIFMESTNALVAFLGTLAIFLIVVYAESSRIELPLAHGKVRGARGRYPIRLLYSSNIPVILMAALLANVNLISLLMYQGPLRGLPLFGHDWLVHNWPGFSGWVGTYLPGGGRTQAISGVAYYFQPFSNGVQDWLLPFLNPQRYGSVFTRRESWQIVARILCYGGAMIGGSIIFAKFWIETTNMGSDAVAKQIQQSGMQIPGFRRDPRIVEKILERYIPVVTVIGGAAVGLLAFTADMIGTVGNASGTGVLLTVGILQRLYEQIQKEQVMEMHPILRGFFGE
jgi:preprotein translocase subunit SecY